MRRLSILAAAVTACFLFTACPNKPTDDPVTIPDGLYEETAQYINRFHTIHDGIVDSSIVFFEDSVFTTSVIISQGDFIYPDMCKDTVDTLRNGRPILANHFIYNASHYCGKNIVPARTAGGYVILAKPQFRIPSLFNYLIDSSYIYQAYVYQVDSGYSFRQMHTFETQFSLTYYDISHTLRPL